MKAKRLLLVAAALLAAIWGAAMSSDPEWRYLGVSDAVVFLDEADALFGGR